MNPRTLRDISSVFFCDFKNFEVEVQTLEKIRAYDEYTYCHSLNVARLSVALGRRLHLNDEQIVELGWAALLHDIGKLHVPISILNKAKKFTPDEIAIMKSHPVESLAKFAETQPVTVEGLRRLSAAFEHHQRYDLKGYPVVHAKKLNLHPFSRIVAVADTFDAMTTDRIYQRRVLPDVALKLMAQGFGTVFDPIVLQAFITCMGAYPVGSLVRLSTDELAVVTHYHQRSLIDRPCVFFVEEKSPRSIDLMGEKFTSLKIIRSEFPEDFDLVIMDLLAEAKNEEDRSSAQS